MEGWCRIMAKFGTFDFGEELFASAPQTGDPYVPPVDAEGRLVRVPWIFQALDDPDIYEFAINPLNCTMPAKANTYGTLKTASGSNIVFQGRSPAQTMSFSGTILTQEHLEAMREWSLKEKQVNITDDLGRGYWIYVTSFSPTRQRNVEYPWRHEYSCEATVLSW